ncbi:MAG TPA: hypothetical protein PKK06_16095 [Phycisphaerae bacterium]|nr:hypothetical protein [Phycisphaerae bacterium]HNU46831.1 hypothetical protein [Phycisphaerae bacterium]
MAALRLAMPPSSVTQFRHWVGLLGWFLLQGMLNMTAGFSARMRGWWGLVSGVGLLCAGCGGNGNPELTDRERQAVVAGVRAPGAFGLAAEVARVPAGGVPGAAQAARVRWDESGLDAALGACPTVSLDTVSLGDLTNISLDVTVDFGSDPCVVLSVDEEPVLTCSGSASGKMALSLTEQAIELEFNQLQCNDEGLDGTLAVEFTLSLTEVALAGDWDLTYQSATGGVTTTGTGTVNYVPVLDGCCDVTGVAGFGGTVAQDDSEWAVQMTDVLMSVEQYESLIPYSGVVDLEGADIRPLIITFNENSPTTGEVTVKIGNFPEITVSLFELEEGAQ